MARVTAIRAAGQAEYRLRDECGQGRPAQRDDAVTYRLGTSSGSRTERVGSGWHALGRAPGGPLGEAGVADMRALMVGAHPDTGEALARPVRRVATAARLPAGPLLEVIEDQGVTLDPASWAGRRVGRMVRGRERDPAHTVAVKDLEKVARRAGITLESVYPGPALAAARGRAGERTEARARGWDLTLDSPKSVSALWAVGGPEVAARIERAYMAAVRDTVAAAEELTAYGQRGQHGGGRAARRVGTHGLMGSAVMHTTARPVDGTSDPHLHAHVMLANLSLGVDGQWGAVGRGGRELYRAVPQLGELHRARLREHLTRELGVAWEQDPRTRAWEITGVPVALRDAYSRRRDQALTEAGEGASAPERRAAARRTVAPKEMTSEASQRAAWASRAQAAGAPPRAVLAAALPPEVLARVEQRERRAAALRAARLSGPPPRTGRPAPGTAPGPALPPHRPRRGPRPGAGPER